MQTQKGSDNNNVVLEDSAFFMKILDADASLSDSDCRAIAGNFLETSAPLPMEQLMWGVSRRGGKILVYAAGTHRLLADEDTAEKLSFARRAFPSFAAIFAAPFQDGCYSYDTSSGRIFFKVANGNVVDFDIYTSPDNAMDAENSECAAFSLSLADGAGGVKFSADFKENGNAPLKWKISNSRIKNLCDIRSKAQLAEISKRVFRQTMVSAFFACAALLFVYMAVWQVSLIFESAKVSQVQKAFDEISPKAKEVEAMSEQLAFITSLSKKPLENTRLIAIANRARSADIEFSKTSATTPTDLQIYGKAESAGSVNRFEENLRKSPYVKSVRASVPSSKSGNAQFEINITFTSNDK